MHFYAFYCCFIVCSQSVVRIDHKYFISIRTAVFAFGKGLSERSIIEPHVWLTNNLLYSTKDLGINGQFHNCQS